MGAVYHNYVILQDVTPLRPRLLRQFRRGSQVFASGSHQIRAQVRERRLEDTLRALAATVDAAGRTVLRRCHDLCLPVLHESPCCYGCE